MDLRAFRYYIETVRQRSFTLAADTLHVTQSTVSKMVRQLEDEIGQPLLIREGRSVRMTDVGQLVYERAQEALGVVHRLQRDISDLIDLDAGALTIGIPPMVNLFFPAVIQSFKAAHPAVQLTIEEAGGQVIEQRVQRGELELGVTVLSGESDTRFATSILGRHPVCLVGTVQSSWARYRRPTLSMLHQQPVVLPSSDYALTHLLHGAFEAEGVRPRVAAQSGQWDFLVSMALAGMGTALLPQPLITRLHLPEGTVVRTLPLREIAWTVGQIWMPDRYLSHAARAWMAVCARHLDMHGRHASGML